MKNIRYKCLNCNNELILSKRKSEYMDGMRCTKCNGGPFNIQPTDEPISPVSKTSKPIGQVNLECKVNTIQLDEAIKKAQCLLELLERIEQQSKNWNEHVLSQYMGLKI